MAVLRAGSKCSRTAVYAPLLIRLAPCPRKRSKYFETILLLMKLIANIRIEDRQSPYN